MVIKARLTKALSEAGKTQADVARATGVTTAGVNLWFKVDGKTQVTIKHENLVKLAKCLNTTTEWLTGKSNNARMVGNVSESSLISAGYLRLPSYRQSETNNPDKGSYDPHLIFRRHWLEQQGFNEDALFLVTALDDSMVPTIRASDTVLVCCDRTAPKDGRVYVLDSNGVTIFRRVSRRANGNLLLSCDNDPTNIRQEEFTETEAANLSFVGQVVWAGGEI